MNLRLMMLLTYQPNGIWLTNQNSQVINVGHFFSLQVLIFDRPVKDCPLFFDVTDHNPPLISFGCRGAKEKGFMQPCNVTLDGRGQVYVIDTGASYLETY